MADAGDKRVLSRFKLQTWMNEMNYAFRSCKVNGKVITPLNTACNDAAGGNIYFLDRHTVKCREQSAIK